MRYLLPPSQKSMADFVNGKLWPEVKAVLQDRMASSPLVIDPPDVAAAKGHQRAGAETILRLIEEIPFEIAPEDPQLPFQRPAVAFTQD